MVFLRVSAILSLKHRSSQALITHLFQQSSGSFAPCPSLWILHMPVCISVEVQVRVDVLSYSTDSDLLLYVPMAIAFLHMSGASQMSCTVIIISTKYTTREVWVLFPTCCQSWSQVISVFHDDLQRVLPVDLPVAFTSPPPFRTMPLWSVGAPVIQPTYLYTYCASCNGWNPRSITPQTHFVLLAFVYKNQNSISHLHCIKWLHAMSVDPLK